jgi:hypothetical protein
MIVASSHKEASNYQSHTGIHHFLKLFSITQTPIIQTPFPTLHGQDFLLISNSSPRFLGESLLLFQDF